MKKILWLALIMASPIAAANDAPAPTESTPPAKTSSPMEKAFNQMDADFSGLVSRDELKSLPKAALLLENFSKIDTNHDDGLNLEEIQSFLESLRKKQESFLEEMKKADKDSDGAWTKKELKSAKGKLSSLEKNFDMIDSNHDKKITEQEIAGFVQSH